MIGEVNCGCLWLDNMGCVVSSWMVSTLMELMLSVNCGCSNSVLNWNNMVRCVLVAISCCSVSLFCDSLS